MSLPAIDVHAHVATPRADALIADQSGIAEQNAVDLKSAGRASAEYNRAQIGALIPALTDPALRLAAMDAAEVNIQTVSATPVPRHWLGEELAAAHTRAVNESVVEHCTADTARLRPVAAVPLQHPELAITELTHAVENLGMVGVQISSTAGPGRELDHESLEPFWKRVTELDIPVLIHPWGCSLGERLDIGYMFNHVGNPTETSVALSRLIFGGVLDRHESLRIWGAHGGGWLPSYSGRADHAWEQRSDAQTCVHRPSSYLRRMWFDALLYNDHGVRHLVESVGASQVTIGTDYPFDMGVTDPIGRLRAAGLSDDALHAITHESAVALFGAARLGL